MKLAVAQRTLTGGSLFGYLVDSAGGVEDSFGDYALLAAAVAVPLWWRRRRLVAFALIAMAIAWAQMLFNRNTGTGAHHVVLLWPLPQVAIATAIAGLAERCGRWGPAALAALLALLCGANYVVLNEYRAAFDRNGPAAIWTDAIFPLSRALDRYRRNDIVVTDWGSDNSLRLLGRGRLRALWNIGDLLEREPTAAGRQRILDAIAIPDAVFVTHTPQFEIENGAAARLYRVAQSAGYRRESIQTIADSHGHRAFELWRFAR